MQINTDLMIIIATTSLAIVLFYGILRQWDNKKTKIRYALTFILFLCAIGITTHTYRQSIAYTKNKEFYNAFKNGEMLVCNYQNEKIKVSQETFIYFPDLLSFFGKNELKGITIPIENCIQHTVIHNKEFIND